MSNRRFTICMEADTWLNSEFSTIRHYGGAVINGHQYCIINKEGITVQELCDTESPHYIGDGEDMAIKEGEPADLIREDFIPYYKKLGRDKFIEVLKAHPRATNKELKELCKITYNPDKANKSA